MDIKELDKKQLILLTLLITFVVSIATGIITVSLMNQMPKSVPQTINNVIQRTIEKVTTVPALVVQDTGTTDNTKSSSVVFGDGDAIVSVYSVDSDTSIKEANTDTTTDTSNIAIDQNDTTVSDSASNNNQTPSSANGALGQGVIISDIGLVLVDNSILTESQNYKVVMNNIDFDASILKKFGNGFTILKIEKKTTDSTGTNTFTKTSSN